MRIIGVDPGVSGAIAWLDTQQCPAALRVSDMPVVRVRGKTEISRADLVNFLTLTLTPPDTGAPWQAAVEQVSARPGQGVSSMFNFGKSYGTILGVLAALRVPTTLITPQRWRGLVQVSPGKDGSRARAAELFPAQSDLFSRRKDDGRADAALIALALSRMSSYI